MKKTIVISAVSLVSGGTLTIAQDCLRYLSKIKGKYRIIVLVHDIKLYSQESGIEYLEYPNAKSWLKRLYYEFFYCKEYSKNKNIFLWFSLHDITSNVVASKRVVYCHNPSPFFKGGWYFMFKDFNFFLFTSFYRYLYQINIKKNEYVVVQQKWLKYQFEKMYGLNNVIVSYPELTGVEAIFKKKVNNEIFTIFFPSVARVFKNFEVLCEAASILRKNKKIQFIITISGEENSYARRLLKSYSNLKNIKFIGLISREEVFEYYKISDLVVFPSLLETWGLPITEAKAFNVPLLLSDLEYAHETVGNYEKVTFFDPNDSKRLATIIDEIFKGEHDFEGSLVEEYDNILKGWATLFDKLLSEK